MAVKPPPVSTPVYESASFWEPPLPEGAVPPPEIALDDNPCFWEDGCGAEAAVPLVGMPDCATTEEGCDYFTLGEEPHEAPRGEAPRFAASSSVDVESVLQGVMGDCYWDQGCATYV